MKLYKGAKMAFEEREKKSLKLRMEKFVKLGEDKYVKGTYDYSLAKEEYKNNRTPVNIICNRCDNDPFLVYPFVHTFHGVNDKGTCPHCYVPVKTVQETRWNPNLPERIQDFRNKMFLRHGENSPYSYPHLDKEYKSEYSTITVVCNSCNSKPYIRVARTLKDLNRYSGCEFCNKEVMRKKIIEKNKERQLRNQTIKDLPREYGCIYKISNDYDGKFYIGYTTLTAERRFKAHKDETRRMQKGIPGKSSYLHNAMNHHSIEHFKVEILEEFTDVTPLFLAKLEMNYIAKLDPDYNVSPGGEIGRSKGYKKKSS